MARYATAWKACSKETYLTIYKSKKLALYSSYTNLDGDDGISCQPQLLTTWGDDQRELIKSHATRDKESVRDRSKFEFDYKYYIATEWGDEGET